MAEKYNNPTKETWRGWAWNQIRSRGVLPGETVMVLCGEGGYDFEIARRKGYSVIGVDINSKCVDSFRAKGGIAVCDSLKDQLITIRPKALIADMLGGATSSTLGMLIDATAICDVVVFNLLRGRDNGICEMPGSIPKFSGRQKSLTEIGKHRGKIATTYLLWHYADEMGFGRFIPNSLFEATKPDFHSYRSKDSRNLYYDSGALTTRKCTAIKNGEACDLSVLSNFASRSSNRKAAAAKALLTMRRRSN